MVSSLVMLVAPMAVAFLAPAAIRFLASASHALDGPRLPKHAAPDTWEAHWARTVADPRRP